MPRKKSRVQPGTNSHSRQTRNLTDAPWQISSADTDYPALLAKHQLALEWKNLHGMGNRGILRNPCVGLICSVQCPGSVIIKTFDAIRELRDADVVVAGGFHSPMEKECLDFLLRGNQPVIVCPAKHVSRQRLSSGFRAALESGRLLLISPSSEKVKLTTRRSALKRNEFVAAMSAAVLVPHASPAGTTATLVQSLLAGCLPILTLDDESNSDLLKHGARRYTLKIAMQISSKTTLGTSPMG
jgi:predicted Rossmann fold nucleotide-binding protein DprA/Smf involved in DNA uptake